MHDDSQNNIKEENVVGQKQVLEQKTRMDDSSPASASLSSSTAALDYIEVTPKSFTNIVMNGTSDVLLVFYSPRCGHCHQSEPTYFRIANKLKQLPSVEAARLDISCYHVPDYAKKAGLKVPGTPIVYLVQYKPDVQVTKYKGIQDLNLILEWMKQMGAIVDDGAQQNGTSELQKRMLLLP
jgi:thioredoxin-like negative regulator of GroEL